METLKDMAELGLIVLFTLVCAADIGVFVWG